jgi:hypothetical protein
VGAELELGDDAEVAAAAAQRPEQVGMGGPRRPHDLPVGQDHFGGEKRVDRQPVTAHQPPEAAAEREPADAGVRDLAGRDRQAERLRRGVELAEQRAAAPSRTERPETECPPPRTVNGSPVRTAAATSSVSVA